MVTIIIIIKLPNKISNQIIINTLVIQFYHSSWMWRCDIFYEKLSQSIVTAENTASRKLLRSTELSELESHDLLTMYSIDSNQGAQAHMWLMRCDSHSLRKKSQHIYGYQQPSHILFSINSKISQWFCHCDGFMWSTEYNKNAVSYDLDTLLLVMQPKFA